MTRDDLIRYWVMTADYDFSAMQRSFSSGEYVWALFIGHLAIEKLLKACCVKAVGADFPRTHNLVRLAEVAKIETTEQRKEMLSRLTTFNVRARYPDWQFQFYQRVNREYAAEQIETVREIRQWLLQVLSQRSNQS